MDVSRSVSILRRIAVGLRVIAWVVLATFLAGAVGLAQKLAFLPFMDEATSTVTTTTAKIIPFTAGATGILAMIMGVVCWVVLLAMAETMMMIVAIEANTRRAAEAAAGVAAPVEERVNA